uniref:C-type lectin domain-containing protein n=1 Tax=Myripristis murdjan TaxID=586833 RepID=A0A667WP73_9TELE
MSGSFCQLSFESSGSRLPLSFISTCLCQLSSTHRHRHYIFIAQKLSWHEAQRYCRERHVDFATVEDMDDVKELFTLLPGDVKKAWSGLYRVWDWSPSSSEDYQKVETFCGAMGHGATWFAADCSPNLSYTVNNFCKFTAEFQQY